MRAGRCSRSGGSSVLRLQPLLCWARHPAATSGTVMHSCTARPGSQPGGVEQVGLHACHLARLAGAGLVPGHRAGEVSFLPAGLEVPPALQLLRRVEGLRCRRR